MTQSKSKILDPPSNLNLEEFITRNKTQNLPHSPNPEGVASTTKGQSINLDQYLIGVTTVKENLQVGNGDKGQGRADLRITIPVSWKGKV